MAKKNYSETEQKAGEHLARLVIACEDAAADDDTGEQAAAVIRAASELAGMLAAAGVPVSLISSAIFADMVMQFVQQTGGEATVDRLVRTADLVGPIPSLDQAKLIAAEVAGSA